MRILVLSIIAIIGATLSGCATSLNPASVSELSPTPRTAPTPQIHLQQEERRDTEEQEANPLMELPPQYYRGVAWIPDGCSVSLATQEVCCFKQGVPMHCAKISSGKKGYETVTGDFRVYYKDPMVLSYKYPTSNGEPAKMPWSVCFEGDHCMHAGHLPGYPASHGCVRMSERDAKIIYDIASPGTRVVVSAE